MRIPHYFCLSIFALVWTIQSVCVIPFILFLRKKNGNQWYGH